MSVFRANNAATDRTWSVPHPRPAWTELDEAPTERLYETDPEPEPTDPPPPRPRRGGVVFAVLLAVLALGASAVAVVIAWRALTVAGTHPTAAPTPAGATPSYVSPSEPALSAEPAEPAASPEPSAPAASAAAEYPVSYSEEPLEVQVGCASVMYLDLDEPRADADQQLSDLRYDSRCGGKTKPTLSLGPGAAGGSQVDGSDTDADGCDRAIRTSPLGSGADVPAVQGTVLCVLTSAVEGDRPRMVLVEVTDVAVDGTAGLRATSWTVP